MRQFHRVAIAAALASTCILTRAAAIDDDERRQPMVDETVGRRDFINDTQVRFAPNSYDATTRTIDAVISTGAQVKRFYFTEELEISPDAIDLGRATTGMVPLLDSHNQCEAGAVLGSVSNVRIENGQLVASLQFADTDRARAVEGMVAAGVLKGISIGYRVNTWTITSVEDGQETWTATRWELLEVSIVSVPADANAVVRAAPGQSQHGTGATATTEKDEDMRRNQPGGGVAHPNANRGADAPAPAAAPAAGEETRGEPAQPAPAAPAAAPAAPEAQRGFVGMDAVNFVNLARAHDLETRATELVAQVDAGTISADAARSALMTAAAERQRAETAPARGATPVTDQRADSEVSRDAIAGALVARALRQDPTEQSRQYMGMSLLQIAAARANVSANERDPDVILRAAMTTSDFPHLMEVAANKVLLARYNAATPTYQAIAARRDLNDFKPTGLLRVGDFPTLLPYQEDGEIKGGTINEGKESVTLGSYGRIVRLSRQAIVNDDLGAFDMVFASIGMTVARFENALFFALLAQNSGNGPKLSDGVNFFNAAHKNLAGSGGAPDVTTLGAARAAMRKQVDLDGNPLNVAPSIILVGPDTETGVQQLLAPIQAQQIGNVNPFAGTLKVEVDAAIVGNGWDLFVDPSVLPAFNYGYLADAPGPKVMTKEGFTHDGMAWRVTEDFYVGAVDYRAGYRNPGA